jgi:hypothetical protein
MYCLIAISFTNFNVTVSGIFDKTKETTVRNGTNRKYIRIYYNIYHRAEPQGTIPQIASTQYYCMAQRVVGKMELDQFKIKRII